MESDADRADPEGRAEEILNKGEGEKPSPSYWTEERRRARSEEMKRAWAAGTAPRHLGKKKRARPPKAQAGREPITEQDEQFVGLMFATAWNLAGPALKLEPLTEDESLKLGKAAAPVIQKWLPMLGDWSLEINLVLVVGALAQAKRKEWRESHAAEIIEISPGSAPTNQD